MVLESVGDKTEQGLERGAKFRSERRLAHIGLKERSDYIQLDHFLDGLAGGSDGRLPADDATRALEFGGIHCGNLAVVVEIVKRLVNTGKVLSVGKGQKLVFAEPIGLVHFNLGRSSGNQKQGQRGCQKMAYFGN